MGPEVESEASWPYGEGPPTPADYDYVDEISVFGDDTPVLYVAYNIDAEGADYEAARWERDFWNRGDMY